MSNFPQLQTHPYMNPGVVLRGEHWRIGILTDSLIRLEWSDDGVFEDHATQMVMNRDWDARPRFTHAVRDGRLIVDTPALRLTYDMQRFSKEGLSVVVKGVHSSTRNTWNYGEEQRNNLRGTARTLDEVDGETDLGFGVISRDGWAVIDDSSSNVIVDADTVNDEPNPFGTWVAPRDSQSGRVDQSNSSEDLYVFAYGHRYIEAIADFYRLTGPTPLLPRFALGNWWSRYHRYTEREYLDLIKGFEREGIPFTTAVIDMDWHLVDDVDPKYGSGWTGYTWNRKFFPDPERFLAELHSHGLKTSPNVHPRDGIRAFEEGYTKAAEHMGIDPASGDPVEFDLTSPKFMQTYFDLHHELEDQGVDFWWLDWQQGGVTRQKGLDPLWMLNHLHYLDSGRDGRWPLTFSRYAGPGSHRYPVGFSGDTVVTWDSLKFQPYFTSTASNIGYGWWSHDIGGHMFGYRDEELEARWYQLGVFSPINRLHSTDSPFNGKEPWNFHTQVRDSMDSSLRLRHELLPYLYTMNWRAAVDGRPIVEPMYWQSPEIGSAYDMENEFRFGTELVAAPITSPVDRDVQLAKTDVWLPQGTWFDFFTGRRYEAFSQAGRKFEAWRGLDRIPVFAKAGGIVPMQPLDQTNGAVNSVDNPRHVQVVAFPGADGEFILHEDNGDYDELNTKPGDNTIHQSSQSLGAIDSARAAAADLHDSASSVGASELGGSADATSSPSSPYSSQAAGSKQPTSAQRSSRATVLGTALSETAPSLAKTKLALHWVAGSAATFVIEPAEGNAAALPQRRAWTIVFRGVESARLEVHVDGEPMEISSSYDEQTLSLTVEIPETPVTSRIEVLASSELPLAHDTSIEDAFQVLYNAQIHYLTKEKANTLIHAEGHNSLNALHTLESVNSNHPDHDFDDSHMPESVIQAIAEQLLRA